MKSSHPSPSFSRAARGLVVVALCVSLGLQWAVLQGVAWTGMLISYSRDGSLIEAVTKTFDGDHPCPLCKVVESGRKQDREQEQNQPTAKKFDAVLVLITTLVPPPGSAFDYHSVRQTPTRRAEAPPWMPPRAMAA